MRRGYAVIVPRSALAKVGVERLFCRRGFHNFPDASTAGDAGGTVDIADGC